VSVAESLDGRIGEAWAGEVPNGIHVNVVLARRGSAAAAAAIGALASPSPGHVPFLAALEGGRMIRPATIVVNKTTLEGETLERLTWGAAQLGIAQGVLDCVADGTLPAREAHELVVLVVVWVDPEGTDETAVCAAAREATAAAIADAATPPDAAEVEAVAARREGGSNRFYGGGR
jgi:5,6,7,8-tetrahydromethanopterin hydro-lyase